MKISFILMYIVTLAISCKSTGEGGRSFETQDLATDSNPNTKCLESSNGRYTLCYTDLQEEGIEVESLLKFTVIDNKSGERVYENSVIGGYVKWITDDEIEYFSTPGIERAGDSNNEYVKVYNLSTKKEMTKTKGKGNLKK